VNSFTKTAAEWELVEWKRLGQFPCGNGQAKPNDVRNWKWGLSSDSKKPRRSRNPGGFHGWKTRSQCVDIFP